LSNASRVGYPATMTSYESTAAFRELLDVLRDGDQYFFEGFG